MNLLEVIKTRRSVRRYKLINIPDDVIHQLIDAARHTPSADNIQPWEFIIIKDKHIKEQLAKPPTLRATLSKMLRFAS